jgi:hypothetical protein
MHTVQTMQLHFGGLANRWHESTANITANYFFLLKKNYEKVAS